MQFPSVARIALILTAFSLSASAVALPEPMCQCIVCDTVNGVEVCKSCC
jgi:uncharacterized membrane protein